MASAAFLLLGPAGRVQGPADPVPAWWLAALLAGEWEGMAVVAAEVVEVDSGP